MARMSVEQFDRSLDLLPPAMRGRAAALRALAFGPQLDLADAIALAFDAAYAGDEAAAGQMLAQAELLAAAARPGARPVRTACKVVCRLGSGKGAARPRCGERDERPVPDRDGCQFQGGQRRVGICCVQRKLGTLRRLVRHPA
jgi:hypothetical protein